MGQKINVNKLKEKFLVVRVATNSQQRREGIIVKKTRLNRNKPPLLWFFNARK